MGDNTAEQQSSPLHKAVSSVFRRISSQSLVSLGPPNATPDQRQPLLGTAVQVSPEASASIQEAALVSEGSPIGVIRSTERRQPRVMVTPLQQQRVLLGGGAPTATAVGGEQGPPPELRLSRSNSMVSEHERRVFSSLIDTTSSKEKLFFLIFTALAIIFRCIAVFMVTTESSMDVDMELYNGERVRLYTQVIQDSYLPDVLSDLYHAGAVGTLVITLCGSIIVPLIRIALVFLCYCVPVEERYHDLRTFILFVLDHVGRFILVDIFAMGYVSVFMHKRISLLEILGLHPYPLIKDVTMSMDMELYSTFYAGIASNIAGTVLCHVLLLKSIPRPPLSEKAATSKQTLLKRFRIDQGGYLMSLEPVPMFVALVVSVLCLIHLVIFEAEIVSFEATGATAALMPSTGPTHFNIWTIATDMKGSLYSSGDIADIGIYLLCAIYFIVVIVLPIAIVSFSFVILLVPLDKRLQFNMLFSSPFWFSWCSVDIFLVITLSEYFEMGHVTEYMSDVQYPQLCEFIKNKLHQPCAGVDIVVSNGIYSLLVLCVSLLFIRARFIRLYEMMGQNETTDRLPLIIV